MKISLCGCLYLAIVCNRQCSHIVLQSKYSCLKFIVFHRTFSTLFRCVGSYFWTDSFTSSINGLSLRCVWLSGVSNATQKNLTQSKNLVRANTWRQWQKSRIQLYLFVTQTTRIYGNKTIQLHTYVTLTQVAVSGIKTYYHWPSVNLQSSKWECRLRII